MRYRIIDTEHVKYNEDGFKPEPYFAERILSEEESLAKFKEIWEAGQRNGVDAYYVTERGFDPREQDFDDYSKTL